MLRHHVRVLEVFFLTRFIFQDDGYAFKDQRLTRAERSPRDNN